MNMMVSGLTGAAPVCVHEDEVLDFGTGKGISITPAFTMRRDTCTSDLIDLFGRDTLVESTEYVRKFGSNKFRKVPWDDLDSILVSRPASRLAPDSTDTCTLCIGNGATEPSRAWQVDLFRLLHRALQSLL